MMTQLAITVTGRGAQQACSLCGKRSDSAAGPALVLTERLAPVCQECGKKHAPSLAALVNLARVAERVGRIGHHTLVPPLGALLDLTHAAEHYTHAAQVPERQVA